MSSRLKDLEKQVEEIKKVENSVLNSLSGCDNPNDQKKDAFWKAVVPHLKSGIERKVREGFWDVEGTKTIVFEKMMQLVFGTDILDNLNKL